MLKSPNMLSAWNYFIVEAEHFSCHESKNSCVSRKHNKEMLLIIGSTVCLPVYVHTSVTIKLLTSDSSHSVQHYQLILI
jgi:hypothetical protein